ncbi:MAG: hypothetical protein QM775_20285 [Pirellulales bacterium]
MKRLSFIALLVAAPVLALAGYFAAPSQAVGLAKSACGCTDCRCPNCNGEFCTCDKCECGSCGCAKGSAEAKPATAGCCSVRG